MQLNNFFHNNNNHNHNNIDEKKFAVDDKNNKLILERRRTTRLLALEQETRGSYGFRTHPAILANIPLPKNFEPARNEISITSVSSSGLPAGTANNDYKTLPSNDRNDKLPLCGKLKIEKDQLPWNIEHLVNKKDTLPISSANYIANYNATICDSRLSISNSIFGYPNATRRSGRSNSLEWFGFRGLDCVHSASFSGNNNADLSLASSAYVRPQESSLNDKHRASYYASTKEHTPEAVVSLKQRAFLEGNCNTSRSNSYRELLNRERFDTLIDNYLTDENDKINLSYYLNEFETKKCDLSELLTNLLEKNLLIKLPNPLIKYEFLSLIRELYIVNHNQQHEKEKFITKDDADDYKRAHSIIIPGGDNLDLELDLELDLYDKYKLDLRLFDAIMQRYLMASNELIKTRPGLEQEEPENQLEGRQLTSDDCLVMSSPNNSSGEEEIKKHIDSMPSMSNKRGEVLMRGERIIERNKRNGQSRGVIELARNLSQLGLAGCSERGLRELSGIITPSRSTIERASRRVYNNENHSAYSIQRAIPTTIVDYYSPSDSATTTTTTSLSGADENTANSDRIIKRWPTRASIAADSSSSSNGNAFGNGNGNGNDHNNNDNHNKTNGLSRQHQVSSSSNETTRRRLETEKNFHQPTFNQWFQHRQLTIPQASELIKREKFIENGISIQNNSHYLLHEEKRSNRYRKLSHEENDEEERSKARLASFVGGQENHNSYDNNNYTNSINEEANRRLLLGLLSPDDIKQHNLSVSIEAELLDELYEKQEELRRGSHLIEAQKKRKTNKESSSQIDNKTLLFRTNPSLYDTSLMDNNNSSSINLLNAQLIKLEHNHRQHHHPSQQTVIHDIYNTVQAQAPQLEQISAASSLVDVNNTSSHQLNSNERFTFIQDDNNQELLSLNHTPLYLNSNLIQTKEAEEERELNYFHNINNHQAASLSSSCSPQLMKTTTLPFPMACCEDELNSYNHWNKLANNQVDEINSLGPSLTSTGQLQHNLLKMKLKQPPYQLQYHLNLDARETATASPPALFHRHQDEQQHLHTFDGAARLYSTNNLESGGLVVGDNNAESFLYQAEPLLIKSSRAGSLCISPSQNYSSELKRNGFNSIACMPDYLDSPKLNTLKQNLYNNRQRQRQQSSQESRLLGSGYSNDNSNSHRYHYRQCNDFKHLQLQRPYHSQIDLTSTTNNWIGGGFSGDDKMLQWQHYYNNNPNHMTTIDYDKEQLRSGGQEEEYLSSSSNLKYSSIFDSGRHLSQQAMSNRTHSDNANQCRDRCCSSMSASSFGHHRQHQAPSAGLLMQPLPPGPPPPTSTFGAKNGFYGQVERNLNRQEALNSIYNQTNHSFQQLQQMPSANSYNNTNQLAPYHKVFRQDYNYNNDMQQMHSERSQLNFNQSHVNEGQQQPIVVNRSTFSQTQAPMVTSSLPSSPLAASSGQAKLVSSRKLFPSQQAAASYWDWQHPVLPATRDSGKAAHQHDRNQRHSRRHRQRQEQQQQQQQQLFAPRQHYQAHNDMMKRASAKTHRAYLSPLDSNQLRDYPPSSLVAGQAPSQLRASMVAGGVDDGDDDDDDDESLEEEEEDEIEDDNSVISVVAAPAEANLPLSIAEQMKEQANNFVQQYGSARRNVGQHHHAGGSAKGSQARGKQQQYLGSGSKRHSSSSSPSAHHPNRRRQNLQVRRTLRVKIKKSKPILGIAIEGGFNVSGQLLPRIVCVHEDGAAYQCGKLRASDLILEVNGISTVNMTHDEIAKTIANAYYQDSRPYIEFLIGESVHV